MNGATLRQASRTYAQLVPTPVSLLEELDLSLFHKMLTVGEFCCSYLNALEDTALPPRPRELADKISGAVRD
jgi:hypothetical protein